MDDGGHSCREMLNGFKKNNKLIKINFYIINILFIYDYFLYMIHIYDILIIYSCGLSDVYIYIYINAYNKNISSLYASPCP